VLVFTPCTYADSVRPFCLHGICCTETLSVPRRCALEAKMEGKSQSLHFSSSIFSISSCRLHYRVISPRADDALHNILLGCNHLSVSATSYSSNTARQARHLIRRIGLAMYFGTPLKPIPSQSIGDKAGRPGLVMSPPGVRQPVYPFLYLCRKQGRIMTSRKRVAAFYLI